MSQSGFSVSWSSHGSAMCGGLQELQQRAEFVDLTLAADGHLVRAHQLVVGLASPYLKALIRSAATPHPVVFLNNVSHGTLCCLLQYMYTGEVVVPADQLKLFLETGKALHVKGLNETFLDSPQTASADDKRAVKMPASSAIVNPQVIINSESRNVIIRLDNSADTPQASTKRKAKVSTSPSKIRKVSMPPLDFESDGANDNQSSEEDNEEANSAGTSINPETGKELKPQLMFCRSNKGRLQLILNRFMYHHVNSYVDGRRRWDCVDSKDKKCKASAITHDNTLLSRFNAHNHPRHDKRIFTKVKRHGVYSSVDTLHEADEGNQSFKPGAVIENE